MAVAAGPIPPIMQQCEKRMLVWAVFGSIAVDSTMTLNSICDILSRLIPWPEQVDFAQTEHTRAYDQTLIAFQSLQLS